jgi:hypothetical protein
MAESWTWSPTNTPQVKLSKIVLVFKLLLKSVGLSRTGWPDEFVKNSHIMGPITLTLTEEKSRPIICAINTSEIFTKTAQSNILPNRRKFVQSGHPGPWANRDFFQTNIEGQTLPQFMTFLCPAEAESNFYLVAFSSFSPRIFLVIKFCNLCHSMQKKSFFFLLCGLVISEQTTRRAILENFFFTHFLFQDRRKKTSSNQQETTASLIRFFR